MSTPRPAALLAILLLVVGCRDHRPSRRRASTPVATAAPAAAAPPPLARTAPSHRTPYIPPQCYAKTRDDAGRVHNPCYTCHVTTPPPNHVVDADLQLSYDFGPRAR